MGEATPTPPPECFGQPLKDVAAVLKALEEHPAGTKIVCYHRETAAFRVSWREGSSSLSYVCCSGRIKGGEDCEFFFWFSNAPPLYRPILDAAVACGQITAIRPTPAQLACHKLALDPLLQVIVPTYSGDGPVIDGVVDTLISKQLKNVTTADVPDLVYINNILQSSSLLISHKVAELNKTINKGEAEVYPLEVLRNYGQRQPHLVQQIKDVFQSKAVKLAHLIERPSFLPPPPYKPLKHTGKKMYFHDVTTYVTYYNLETDDENAATKHWSQHPNNACNRL